MASTTFKPKTHVRRERKKDRVGWGGDWGVGLAFRLHSREIKRCTESRQGCAAMGAQLTHQDPLLCGGESCSSLRCIDCVDWLLYRARRWARLSLKSAVTVVGTGLPLKMSGESVVFAAAPDFGVNAASCTPGSFPSLPVIKRAEYSPCSEPQSPLSVALFFTNRFLKRLFACYTTLLLCKILVQYYIPWHHKRSATRVHTTRPHANHLIMFCTDVLSTWAECSLKDFFSQALGERVWMWWWRNGLNTPHWAGVGGCWGGGVAVSTLGSCVGKWTQGPHNVTDVWKPQHLCPHTSAPTFYVRQSPSNQPSVQLAINASTRPSRIVLQVSVLCWSLCHSLRGQARRRMQRGREGLFGRASPYTGGRRWRINKKDPKLRESAGAINCRGSAGSQCPLCRWGIFCWWPATGPHMPGERGACRVISYKTQEKDRDEVRIFLKKKECGTSSKRPAFFNCFENGTSQNGNIFHEVKETGVLSTDMINFSVHPIDVKKSPAENRETLNLPVYLERSYPPNVET